MVDERGEHLKEVDAELRARIADLLDHGEIAAANEDREPGKEASAGVIKEVVAPGDGAAQRSLSLGKVARRGGEELQAVLQSFQDGVGCQYLDTRRGQRDREWEALQRGTDPGHGRRILVGDAEIGADGEGPCNEEPYRFVLVERGRVGGADLGGQSGQLEGREMSLIGGRREARHRVFLFPGDVEGTPTGGHDREVRAGAQELRGEGSGGDHLLEVVEDQQAGPGREVLHQQLHGRSDAAVRQPDGPGDRARHQLRLAERLERDEPDTVGIAVRGCGGELEGEPGLADPARAGEGEEARRVEEEEGGREIVVTAHE